MDKPVEIETETEIAELWQYAAEMGYFDDNVKVLNVEVSPQAIVCIHDNSMRLDVNFSYYYGPYRIQFHVNRHVGTYKIQD